MNEWAGLIVSSLERKRRIDGENLTNMNLVSYDRWLVDAVELLLQIELQREIQARPAHSGSLTVPPAIE